MLKVATFPTWERNYKAVEKRVDELLEIAPWPALREGFVRGQECAGSRMQVQFAVMTLTEFAVGYKKSVKDVPAVKVIPDLLNEEMQKFTGVCIPFWTAPPKFRNRQLTLFVEQSTMVGQYLVSSKHQLRSKQVKEQFQATVQEGVAARAAPLRIANRGTMLTHEQIQEFTNTKNTGNADEQAEEERRAKLAAAGYVETIDDEDESSGRRRRGLSIGMAATAAAKPRPKGSAKAGARAKQGAKGGTASGHAPGAFSGGQSCKSLGPATPQGKSGASVVRLALDRSGGKKRTASNSAANSVAQVAEDGTKTLRSVYPTVDIDMVLLGRALGRSVNGVLASALGYRSELPSGRMIRSCGFCVLFSFGVS